MLMDLSFIYILCDICLLVFKICGAVAYFGSKYGYTWRYIKWPLGVRELNDISTAFGTCVSVQFVRPFRVFSGMQVHLYKRGS